MRVWFLKQTNSIDTESSVGANTVVWSREGVIHRITPRQNDAVNDTWMADSGRELYKAVRAADRLTACRIGSAEASLDSAVLAAGTLLREAAGAVAVVGSGRSSVEEQFLTRRLAESLGTSAHLVSRTGPGDGLLVSADRNPNVRGALVTGLISALPSSRLDALAAAIDAGKHVFFEKPVAVDPSGVRTVLDAARRAEERKLCVVTGTQRRHERCYLEAMALVRDGAIGRPVAARCYWNQGGLWHKDPDPALSEMENQVRNWLYFTWLSGDHIVEQHVHNIDVAVWFLGRLPVSALGFGGRARRETGDQFDFFSVDLDFGDGVHIHSQCRQISGTYGKVGEFFTGTEGTAFGGGKIAGRKVDVAQVKLDSDNPYVQEHIHLIRGVIDGKPLNEARQVAESTAVAIMGRISA